MNLFSFLAASLSAPSDMWTSIINWIQGGVANYGWTILLFTLLVKTVISPLDFGMKYTTRQQTLVQKKCAPEIAKLNKKYGADQNTIKIQTQSLYKREGLRMGVGCIVMLVNLVLTMVIFFTLYASLRQVSAYEAINQYQQVQTAYDNAYIEGVINFSDSDEITDRDSAIYCINEFEKAKAFIGKEGADTSTDEYINNKNYYDTHKAIFASTDITNNAVNVATDKWNSIKSSWLWIDNVWVADSLTRPFPDYDGLLSIAKNGSNEYAAYVEANINKETCDKLSNSILEKTGKANNGYFIIAILAGLVTLASQLITQLQNNLKNKKANKLAKATDKANGMSMKIMMIMMPIIMVIFALTTGAAFGIYIVSSSIASIILGEISTLIVDALTKKKRIEVEEYLEKEANRLIRKGRMKE